MAERYKIITSRHTIADLATTTLTQLSTVVDFDAWKSLYTNGSSVLTELSLGAQYTVFQSGGATSAPSWGLITNDNVAASGVANLAWNKLAAGTANYAVITDASGYPTTEQYLDETRGGTGRGTWTQGDIVYASAANTLGAITAVAAGRFLLSAGATTAPAYEAAAKLSWDSANSRLGINKATPAVPLHIESSTAGADQALIRFSTSAGWSTVPGSGKNIGIEWYDNTGHVGHITCVYDGATTNMHFGGLYSGGYKKITNQLMVLKGSGDLGVGTALPSTRLHLYTENATNNAVMDVLTIDRGVSGGSGAANLGVGVPLRLENASGTVTEAARINAIWTDATNATENGELSLWVKNDGTARKLIRTTATGKYYDWIFAANAHDDEFAWAFETNGVRRFQCDVSGTNGAAFRIVPRTDAGAWMTPAVFITRSNGYVGILNYGPSYPLHVTGDINSTTGYRTNGTAGLSATYNVAGTAGSGTLKTMTFSGGILTAVTTW